MKCSKHLELYEKYYNEEFEINTSSSFGHNFVFIIIFYRRVL